MPTTGDRTDYSDDPMTVANPNKGGLSSPSESEAPEQKRTDVGRRAMAVDPASNSAASSQIADLGNDADSGLTPAPQWLSAPPAARDGMPDVLIPLGPANNPRAMPHNNAAEITYVDREGYQAVTGAAYDDASEQKAILIKTQSGTYLNKEQIHRTTFAGTSKDTSEREIARETGFSKRMYELSLSNKIPPKGDERSGIHTPGLMLTDNSGHVIAVDPKAAGINSLKEAHDKYGAENVRLKTPGQSYMTAEKIDARKGEKTAERSFAKMVNGAAEKARENMAEVYVRVDKDRYVSPSAYEALKASNPELKLPNKIKDMDLLVQSPNGHGLLTPKALKFSHGADVHDAILKRNGIANPDEVRTRMNQTKPDAVVRVSADVLLSGKAALASTNGKSLGESFPEQNIYIQNTGKNGKGTGNYNDVPGLRNNLSKQAFERRLQASGVEITPETRKAEKEFSLEALVGKRGDRAVPQPQMPQARPQTREIETQTDTLDTSTQRPDRVAESRGLG